jgi:hypothetical protein
VVEVVAARAGPVAAAAGAAAAGAAGVDPDVLPVPSARNPFILFAPVILLLTISFTIKTGVGMFELGTSLVNVHLNFTFPEDAAGVPEGTGVSTRFLISGKTCDRAAFAALSLAAPALAVPLYVTIYS